MYMHIRNHFSTNFYNMQCMVVSLQNNVRFCLDLTQMCDRKYENLTPPRFWSLKITYIRTCMHGTCTYTVGEKLLSWTWKHVYIRLHIHVATGIQEQNASGENQALSTLVIEYCQLVLVRLLWTWMSRGAGSIHTTVLPIHSRKNARLHCCCRYSVKINCLYYSHTEWIISIIPRRRGFMLSVDATLGWLRSHQTSKHKEELIELAHKLPQNKKHWMIFCRQQGFVRL